MLDSLITNMEYWSEQDRRINHLTGFKPAERDKRQCVSCGKDGHYYYECNNGEFLNQVDTLVNGLKILDVIHGK